MESPDPGLINASNNMHQTSLHWTKDVETAKLLIHNKPELVTMLDVKGNNFVHANVWHENTEFLAEIFQAISSNKNFSEVINQRNHAGTSPLGMIFIKEGEKNINLINDLAKLFIDQKAFDVNAYLNNKLGMDSLLQVKAQKAKKNKNKEEYNEIVNYSIIGGFNILHMALILGSDQILDSLQERNENFGWEKAEYRVNFRYPSLNPQHHMNSPMKLLGLRVENNKELKAKLIKLQLESDKYDYDSGDSDDESAPAYRYKEALLSIRDLIDSMPEQNRDINPDLDANLNFSLTREHFLMEEKFKEKLITQRAKNDQTYKTRMKDIDTKNNSKKPYQGPTTKQAQETIAWKEAWDRAVESVKKDGINWNKEKILNAERIKEIKALENKTKKIKREITESSELIKHHADIVIPHFHGVPFMLGQYTNQQKREVAYKFFEFNQKKLALSDDEDDHSIIAGLHSRTSTASAGLDNLHYIIKATDEELDKLKEKDLSLNKYLTDCYSQNPKSFLNTVCTYVYNFGDEPWQAKKDNINQNPMAYNVEKNPMISFWNELGKISNNVEQDIVKYRFPFISTSKTPKHVVKFALGNMVETQSKGELPTDPKYNSNGFPKHRLAGLSFITSHSVKEIDQMEKNRKLVDMTKLLKTEKLKNQNGEDKSASRIDFQVEVTFFGGVDEKNMQLIIPLIYPNFAKNFQPGYHDKIWGLTEGTYNEFKNNIWENPNNIDIVPKNGTIQQGLIKFITKACLAISSLQDKKPYYYTPINTVKPWTEDTLRIHQDITSYITGNQYDHLSTPSKDDTICKFLSGTVKDEAV